MGCKINASFPVVFVTHIAYIVSDNSSWVAVRAILVNYKELGPKYSRFKFVSKYSYFLLENLV